MAKSKIEEIPQQLEIEKDLLSTILKCPDLRNEIITKLSADDFYNTQNQAVFKKCLDLNQSGNPIEVALIVSGLGTNNEKEAIMFHLNQILDNNPIAVDPDFYIAKLKEATTRRQAIQRAYAIEKEAKSPDCSLEKLESLSNSLSQCTRETLSNYKHFEVITYDDLYNREEKPQIPIATGFLDEGEFTIIYGSGGTGKSMLSLDLAMSIGGGIANLWGVFPIAQQRFSLIIQSENTQQVMRGRMKKKCAGNPEFISGLPLIASPVRHDNILISGDVTSVKFQSYLTDCVNRIKETLCVNIDLIIFDPLISYHDADENDNSRMRSTLDSIAEISNAIGGTPLVIHHTNKDGGLRGASAIIDWARNIIAVSDQSFTRMGESIKQIGIGNDKRNNAKEFDNFILRMDENLNFYPVEPEEIISNKSRERCLNVREALELCGGRVETKAGLVDQYCENAGINRNTAQRHINEATKEGYIFQEIYKEGNLKKARYYLPETG